jgi:hypothetical protein
VALERHTLLIGASQADVGANDAQGVAYVFAYDELFAQWGERVKLTTSDGASGDAFGSDLALHNDTAVIGAPAAAAGRPGAAYVFARTGTSWTQHTRLVASGSISGDQFGASVAVTI